MLIQNIDKEANSILDKFKNGTLTKDKARRLLFVITGVSKTAACKLDRLTKDCSIALYTKSGCSGCGHFVE